MTRKEIINILRKEVDNYDYSLFHSDLEQADKEILQKKINALDKAIKALERESQTFEWCTDCREYDQEKHCCHRYSKVIRNAVEEMKQPKMGHWIPVTERLPKDRNPVLVTAYWHETYQVMQASYFGDGVWWCVPFNNTGKHEQKLKPKAWMPLPKPYKPQESEKVYGIDN